MRLKNLLLVCCLGYAVSVFAQMPSVDPQCQKSILEAEKKRDLQIYSQCGFDDIDQAFVHWRWWTVNNNAYQAMYELCIRSLNTTEGEKLCQKAASGGNGPALIYQADKLYEQGKYIEALQSYTQALKSPLLTPEEKGHISEKIGVLYLNPNSTYYNPAKGWPLIERATTQRGALANNVVGVYSMLGLEKQTVDMKKAFEHLWRAVLLGCPSAEENLGLFYLVHQKKITPSDARQLMQNKIFTCQPERSLERDTYSGLIQRDCDCAQVIQKEQIASQYDYRLISVTSTGAILQDKTGQRFSVMKDAVLPNGAHVSEIRKTALILLDGKQRHVLNLVPDESCIQYCKVKQNASKDPKSALPNVKPYRLTFTASECSDLLYYAERLVDKNLPFVGKKECGFSGEMDEATRILMAQ